MSMFLNEMTRDLTLGVKMHPHFFLDEMHAIAVLVGWHAVSDNVKTSLFLINCDSIPINSIRVLLTLYLDAMTVELNCAS